MRGRELSRAAVVLLAFAVASGAQTPPGDVATVTMRVATNRAWLEQRIEIAIDIALDRDFFAAQSVPMLQRRVDLPVQLTVPWLDANGEAIAELLDGEGPRLAVGARIVRCVAAGTEERAGRTFDRFEVRCVWTGLMAGERMLDPAVLRYAYASAFEETLLGGRQPVDRNEVEVAGSPLRFEVRELPTAGRPEAFSGAVGEFTLEASAEPATVEVGDSVTIAMRVRGSGNLDRFAAPPWPQWPGLAVQGLVERRDGDARVFAFDVLALVTDAPPPKVSFAWFSPGDGRYRSVETDAVTLRVVQRAEGRPLPPRVEKLIAARVRGSSWQPPWWLFLIAVAIPVGLLVRRRRRSRA